MYHHYILYRISRLRWYLRLLEFSPNFMHPLCEPKICTIDYHVQRSFQCRDYPSSIIKLSVALETPGSGIWVGPFIPTAYVCPCQPGANTSTGCRTHRRYTHVTSTGKRRDISKSGHEKPRVDDNHWYISCVDHNTLERLRTLKNERGIHFAVDGYRV